MALFFHYLTLPYLIAGIEFTLAATGIGLAGGLVLGAFLAAMQLSRLRLAATLARGYSVVFRGTPLILQMVFFYDALPYLGIRLPGLLAAGVALAFNEATFIAEMLRAGVLGVDRGQRVAGQALGMTPGVLMHRVVAPQALRALIPALGNEAVTTLKNSSLASVIAVQELTLRSTQLASTTFDFFSIFFASGLMYLVLTGLLGLLQVMVEARFDLDRHGSGRGLARWLPLLRAVQPAGIPIAPVVKAEPVEPVAPRSASATQEAASERAERIAQAPVVVRVSGLSKVYGAQTVLDDLNLSVSAGEVVALLASWGFHYRDLIEEPKPREVVTIFELDTAGEPYARAVYNYVWTPQTDPDGVVHSNIDYPGVRVDHKLVKKRENVLRDVKVPARLHFGTMGVAPAEADYVSSIPPSYTGGNIDDWRAGKGARMYYPVAVAGAHFSVGDPHAAQGDSELGGTAIETSLTGEFEFILHKKHTLAGTILEGLDHPMLETEELWSMYGFTFPNYLAALGPEGQTTVAGHASLDQAMRDAFRKLRRFLMQVHKLSEDEAIALLSVAADFGITQVVDANWGVHGSIRKSVFAER
ncbi:hypothetical protein NECAME_17432 [Necator americanus]|uniref:ABC transmembrane type-1 domain-containing protein n=1 Tax=Necator americanus TaxID=51031 RepID=W2TPD3_NECAM|nr:hypothetical protein NECAME_17432 [Necator americanus]ETN83549.1 hypothetical protein NECAME_17432 [Necator americanus]